MNAYITIPKPCHEDWDKMLPEDQGRHCLQCCKTVIDFTNWEIGDITTHLKASTQQSVCGRFKINQLHTPVEQSKNQMIRQVFLSRISLVKKIAATIVILFGVTVSSCNNEIMGKATKPAIEKVEEPFMGTPSITTPSSVDTNHIKGKIKKPVRKERKCTIDSSSRPTEEILTGEVVMGDTVPGKTDSVHN